MKKTLLILSAFATLFTQAQSDCAEGFYANSFYEDYTSEEELGDSLGGLFHWGEDDLAGDDQPEFQALLTRDPSNSELDVTLSQGEGEYSPMGISFGETDEGKLATIDITDDATFSITITNRSSYNLYFQIALEDTLGNIVAIKSTATEFSTYYLHTIQVGINAGQTKTYDVDFEGGYSANTTNNTLEQNFDFTIVTGVSITVVNMASTGDPDWFPLQISDAEFSIDEIGLGDCPGSNASNEIKSVNNQFSVFPNPSTGVVTIQNPALDGQDSYNVEFYNIVGELVQTNILNSNRATYDVSGLGQGVYFIRVAGTDKNYSAGRIIVK